MRAFIYAAALYCEPCGEAIRARLPRPAGLELENESTWDSGDWPKGPYADGGGEADSPCHCDACGGFLENPLTAEGVAYVREVIERDGARVRRAADWSPALFPHLEAPAATVALDTWAPFYAAELGEA